MSLTDIEILSQILVFFNISFIAVALYALWRNRRQLFGSTPPEIREAEKKAEQIVRRAVEKANQLLVDSELEGVEAVAQRRLDSSKLEKAYQKELADLADSLKEQYKELTANLEKDAYDIKENYIIYTDELKKLSDQLVKEYEHEYKEHLSALTASSSDTLNKNISEQLEKLEQGLDQYRREREKFVDQNIVELLARALEITLGEVMSLEEHKQAVINSLEQAKEEGFFET